MKLADNTSDAAIGETELHHFSIRGTPLLSQGSSMSRLAETPALSMYLKVYADGGENGLHNHPYEDHMFFIVQATAVFLDGQGKETTVGANEGMTVPMGTNYCFRAVGDENLVMLRIGAPADLAGFNNDPRYRGRALASIRHHPDGRDFDGADAENKTGGQRGIPSGAKFGA